MGIILFVVAIIWLIVTLNRKINKALEKSAEILNFQIDIPRNILRKKKIFGELDEVLSSLENSEFLMSTEKLSSNKVFSFGRDHGYHGRLLSHGIIAKDSLHVKEKNLTGYCFTPQDGNALLSSVAASVNYFYEESWIEKMTVFNKYIFKNI